MPYAHFYGRCQRTPFIRTPLKARQQVCFLANQYPNLFWSWRPCPMVRFRARLKTNAYTKIFRHGGLDACSSDR